MCGINPPANFVHLTLKAYFLCKKSHHLSSAQAVYWCDYWWHWGLLISSCSSSSSWGLVKGWWSLIWILGLWEKMPTPKTSWYFLSAQAGETASPWTCPTCAPTKGKPASALSGQLYPRGENVVPPQVHSHSLWHGVPPRMVPGSGVREAAVCLGWRWAQAAGDGLVLKQPRTPYAVGVGWGEEEDRQDRNSKKIRGASEDQKSSKSRGRKRRLKSCIFFSSISLGTIPEVVWVLCWCPSSQGFGKRRHKGKQKWGVRHWKDLCFHPESWL